MQRSSVIRSWLPIINQILILIGILVLAFFTIGKALDFGDDVEGRVLPGSSNEPQVSDEQTLVLISKDPKTFGTPVSFSELDTYFGSDVVFVSASEPAFLITDDERRFQVGDALRANVELTRISSTQLILKQAGEILVFALLDESVN